MGNSRAVQVRRVYDHRVRGDGTRVLVDRVWPRGMTKEKADLDEWCKQIAPSNELRKWYHHAPEKFEEFTRRYQQELTEPARAEALAHLRERSGLGAASVDRAQKVPRPRQTSLLRTWRRRAVPGRLPRAARPYPCPPRRVLESSSIFHHPAGKLCENQLGGGTSNETPACLGAAHTCCHVDLRRLHHQRKRSFCH